MRLLDLYSGAGGAAAGYAAAGFEVVGVDNRPQPRYPYEHHVADALEYLAEHGAEFDAVHASPPCHDHSRATGRNRKAAGTKGTGWLLGATVRALTELAVPWVVENVEGARWPSGTYGVRLCGSSFGLDVRRHRWFATSVPMLAPPCDHAWQRPRFRSLDGRRPGALATVVGVHGHLNYPGEFELRCRAMGIDWMTTAELSQAIPPAMTCYVGERLLAHMTVTVHTR